MTNRLLPIFLASVFCAAALAENWPHWRGPAFNGSTTESSLPSELNPAKNLAWSADLPGPSSATPIVFNDRVFVSATEKGSSKLLALCYALADGRLLWKRDLGIGYIRNERNDYASPSAVTDGKTVYFYFGNGQLAAFDLDGQPHWTRNLQKDHGNFNVLWVYSSSPLLYKGKLYIQVLHRDVPPSKWDPPGPNDTLSPSYLLAIDPATGKDIFKQTRPNDARAESKESFATPIPHEANGRTEILLLGGDCVTGHDPDTGKELWRFGGWNPTHVPHWRIVPSVLVAGDVFVVCTPKRGKVLAIRPGGNGDVSSTHLAWETQETTSDAATPLYYQNKLYVLDGDFKKGITCLDPKTGRKEWFTPIESRPVLRTSPTGADGKLYVMSESADVWVLSAADGAVLSKTSLNSPTPSRASVAPAQGHILIRTGDKLYAFKK